MKKSVGINNLIFPNPALVVGTYDAQGEPNAITLAWGGVASSDPQSISIAVRPSRYSYENLMRTKAFTINLPAVEHATEVDFFGIASGRNTRKFETTKLTPVHGEYVDAPYIAEFPLCMECEVTHTLDIKAHTLFIGEVRNVIIEESLLDEKGNPLWEKANILTYDCGLRVYRAPGEVVGQAFNIGKKFISA